MNHELFFLRLRTVLESTRRELLAQRVAGGHWVGELSASALSTATAVCALTLVDRHSRRPHAAANSNKELIDGGLDWLARHANADGGWGDTTKSLSNISTTALCWAAFGAVAGADERCRETVSRAERWLSEYAGSVEANVLAPAIIRRYGKDRTFSVPILTMCALAGRLGDGPESWRWVLPLPFELAACPHQWFAALRLPVVSYALPALIAIGQARHHHRPSRNPLARLARMLARSRTLEILKKIQPSSGGFLEATPLTSFVTMSLAASGNPQHPVTVKAVEFLRASARADGSWPIDTNLSTWVTTLSVNALLGSATKSTPRIGPSPLTDHEREQIRSWLLRQQYVHEHPYTHAAPGGWAWTNLPGGVPDADDTAGALIALRNLGESDDSVRAAASAGIYWLLGLQNRDGGIPTFCRGWGSLPFDRSSPDLTAHAMRAWLDWLSEVSNALQRRIEKALAQAVAYLERVQRTDGCWIPLWFGNQFGTDDENPIYGTSRVLLALQALPPSYTEFIQAMLARGMNALLSLQNKDGGWGGALDGTSSVEETALAVEALAGHINSSRRFTNLASKQIDDAVFAGASWLMERVESGQWKTPAPIGFYFAKLWYYEKLYPQIFTVGALQRLLEQLCAGRRE